MEWPVKYLQETLLKAKSLTNLGVRGIAKESKVSISAVSRAMNGKELKYSTGVKLEKWALWARAKK